MTRATTHDRVVNLFAAVAITAGALLVLAIAYVLAMIVFGALA